MLTVPPFLVASLAAMLAALAGSATAPNRFVRGRLVATAVLCAAASALELPAWQGLGDTDLLHGAARLAFTLALTLAGVTLAANAWRGDGASERVPAIVQDVLTIAVFAVTATLVLEEKLLTTSAVGAVVVGFALQDTLGNLFAGLAIQVEKPFRVGQWVRIGTHEGRVQQVTWRATKLFTKAGQSVTVPNNVLSKESILNYSEPTAATRLEVSVGASYLVPPNEVKDALREAVRNAPLVLSTPEPLIVIDTFDASAITYSVLFWIDDFGRDRLARDQVRTSIWYTFRRRGIEIPWPIQVHYERTEPSGVEPVRHAAVARLLGAVDLLTPLSDAERDTLAQACAEHLFAAGECIVRQGDAGDSMFLVLSGSVRVRIEPSGQELAVIGAGGVFGEMSMLTGETRTATVLATDDTRLLEIDAATFRDLAVQHPGLLEQVSAVVERRRAGLAEAQATGIASGHVSPSQASILTRIQRFLRI